MKYFLIAFVLVAMNTHACQADNLFGLDSPNGLCRSSDLFPGSPILARVQDELFGFGDGHYSPRWTVTGGYDNIENHLHGWPHFKNTSGKSRDELFAMHDMDHDRIGPVSAEEVFANSVAQDDCPGGVCPVPQEAVVVRGQAEPVVSVLHGRVMEQVVPRATVKDYFIVRSESVTYSHADPMRSYSYRYSERPRWRPFQRMRERIRARRSLGLGIFQ